MPTSVVKLASVPLAKPLDEAVWQAWVLKGRVQDERDHAARMQFVKWISLTGLLFAAAAGLWSHPIYNPVAPAFSFSGEWQRALVVASAIPFVASLTGRSAKLVPNG